MLTITGILLLALGSLASAQSSTPSGGSSSASAITTSAATSSSVASIPTSTSGKNTSTVQLPPLTQCSYATFSFTVPERLRGLPKHIGFYPSSSSTWIETVHLSAAYNDLTQGSFSWLVDLPVGLPVAAMFYVTDPSANGAVPANGSASTSETVIKAGVDSACLAANDGASTTPIVSFASALDPTFVYDPNAAQQTARANGVEDPKSSGGGGGGGGGVPTGAIVGGVLGGVAIITLLALVLFYLKRRHDRSNKDQLHAAQSLRDAESYSMYSGAGIGGDKRPHFGNGNGSVFGVSTIGGPPGSLNTAPPGLYWGSDEHGNPILLQMPSHHGLVGGEQQQDWAGATSPPPPTPPAVTMSEVPGPRRTAPIGTLPEPMGDDDDSHFSRHHLSARAGSTTAAIAPRSPSPSAHTSSPFTPIPEARAAPLSFGTNRSGDGVAMGSERGGENEREREREIRGAQGLADPSSFGPGRF